MCLSMNEVMLLHLPTSRKNPTTHIHFFYFLTFPTLPAQQQGWGSMKYFSLVPETEKFEKHWNWTFFVYCIHEVFPPILPGLSTQP